MPMVAMLREWATHPAEMAILQQEAALSTLLWDGEATLCLILKVLKHCFIKSRKKQLKKLLIVLLSM